MASSVDKRLWVSPSRRPRNKCHPYAKAAAAQSPHLSVYVHAIRALPRLALVHHVGHQIVLGGDGLAIGACSGAQQARPGVRRAGRHVRVRAGSEGSLCREWQPQRLT